MSTKTGKASSLATGKDSGSEVRIDMSDVDYKSFSESDRVNTTPSRQHEEENDMSRDDIRHSTASITPPQDSTNPFGDSFDFYSWSKGDPYVYLNPPKIGPWETMKKGVDKYDEEMCRVWKDDLDTMLVFTGLFSAVVTAFCVEAFKLLSQDPAETTNALLRVLILQQLRNSTLSQLTDIDEEQFLPAAQDVQINVLYFLSLTLALSVSFLCILGKQWIKEFQRDIAVSARDALRIRQIRFDALRSWKVPQILAALPVILQAALLLFFAGLLTQLWNVTEYTTAGVVSAAVGLTLFIVLITTVTPAHCRGRTPHEKSTPFRSPQSWIYLIAVSLAQVAFHSFRSFVGLSRREDYRTMKTPTSWVDLDHLFLTQEVHHTESHDVTSVHSSLRWILKTIGNTDAIENAALWGLLPQLHPPNLVRSIPQLTNYVLSKYIPKPTDESRNLLHLYHEYATEIRDQHRDNINVAYAGHNRANLLRSIAKNALDKVSVDDSYNVQDTWDCIIHSCRDSIQVQDKFFTTGNVESVVNKKEDSSPFGARILEASFRIIWRVGLSPSVRLDWTSVMYCLFTLTEWDPHGTQSPSAPELADKVASQFIPNLAQRRRSIPLLCDIGEATIEFCHLSWKHGVGMFDALDAAVIDLCRDTEGSDGSEGATESNMQRWRQIREQFIHKTWDTEFQAPVVLFECHYDTLHGPLPPLSNSSLIPAQDPKNIEEVPAIEGVKEGPDESMSLR